MNVKFLRGVAALALLLVSHPTVAQNVRYEWQGTAYIVAENRMIAERVVDRVLGRSPGGGAQIVFFRPADSLPGELSLSGDDAVLAQLPSGAYYAIAVVPGSHKFAVDGDTLSLQVAPGERRYVRVGHERTSPQLSPTNALTFLRLVTGKREPLFLN